MHHVVRRSGWGYLGAALAQLKAQLCGRFTVAVDGRRVERDLPGRQGRLLLAYLLANRAHVPTRDELIDALWGGGRDGGLAPLLSKVRRLVPLDGLRIDVEAAEIDVELAVEALHRAESALALDDPRRAWGPAQVALFVTGRQFLAGEDALWIDDQRRRLADVYVRAVEAYAASTLGVGGTELAAAIRSGRRLVDLEPYRESGYRILMEALSRQGNGAEALVVYDRLRCRLREDLGVSPSEETQALYRRLLR